MQDSDQNIKFEWALLKDFVVYQNKKIGIAYKDIIHHHFCDTGKIPLRGKVEWNLECCLTLHPELVLKRIQ